jgi:hypothetical protein
VVGEGGEVLDACVEVDGTRQHETRNQGAQDRGSAAPAPELPELVGLFPEAGLSSMDHANPLVEAHFH